MGVGGVGAAGPAVQSRVETELTPELEGVTIRNQVVEELIVLEL